MTRAVRDRRWRQRVLLAGVLLLVVCGVLLLQGSRPQASEPADPLEDHPKRRPGRSYSIRAGDTASQLADEEEGEPQHELTLKLVDSVTGDPIVDADVDLFFSDGDGASRSLKSDDEGGVSLQVTDELEDRHLDIAITGFEDLRLTREEVDALLETGSGTFRLAPQATLIARMVGANGEPITDFRVCLVEEEDSSCEYASNEGTAKIEHVPLGEQQLWATASASDEDQDQSDRLAVQSIRFAPGEEKTVTFQAASRVRHTIVVSLVDAAGAPLSAHLVDASLEPRDPAGTALDRALFQDAQHNQRITDNQVIWHLPRGGWFNVKVINRLGDERTLAEGTLFAGEGESRATLTINEKPIACVLVTEAGEQLPILSYNVTVVSSEGRDGFGGAGGSPPERIFFWPGGATEVEVTMRSVARQRGTVILKARDEACVAKASRPAAPL